MGDVPTEVLKPDDVADVAGLRLAQRATRRFKLVIHEEDRAVAHPVNLSATTKVPSLKNSSQLRLDGRGQALAHAPRHLLRALQQVSPQVVTPVYALEARELFVGERAARRQLSSALVTREVAAAERRQHSVARALR